MVGGRDVQSMVSLSMSRLSFIMLSCSAHEDQSGVWPESLGSRGL